MAKVKIGGEDYDLPELTLDRLDALAPLVDGLQSLDTSGGGMVGSSKIANAHAKIIATWLEATHPELSEGAIRKRLTLREMQGLGRAVIDGLKESGVVFPDSGEPGAAPGAPGAATTPPRSAPKSNESSVNSSRRAAKAVRGT